MAFEGVFIDKSGRPFSREIAETLEACVTEVLLLHKDADPSLIVGSAVKVGERANSINSAIRHLYSYAKTVIGRDIRRAQRRDLIASPTVVARDPGQLELTRDEDYLQRLERRMLVSSAVAILSEMDRQILWLHYRDYDHASIAKALNITALSSRQRLARAQKALRQYLAQK